MDKEYLAELDLDDRDHLRDLRVRVEYGHKETITFEDAVNNHLDYFEYLDSIVEKYGVDDDREFIIDEITGKIYYTD